MRLCLVQTALDVEAVADFVGEKQGGQQHAHPYTAGQVMGGHDDHNGRDHDDVSRQWVFFQIAQGIPAKGADGDHDHHRDEDRHRDSGDS
jgi:hypothetical protein